MSEILTYRVRSGGGRWEVHRDGHSGPLADFATRDEALVWADSEAGKIGMGRVVVESDDGVESQHEHIDAAVRDELHLPQ